MNSIRMAILILALAAGNPATAGPADDFSTLLNEVWEWQLAENPTFASRLGSLQN